MKVIVGDRGSGKTTALINEMAKHPGSIMLCPSAQMADYTEHLAKRLYPDIDWVKRFKPFNGALSPTTAHLRGYKHVFVDDLDLCLATVFGTTVEMVSVNGELFDTEEQERQKLREQLREQQL